MWISPYFSITISLFCYWSFTVSTRDPLYRLPNNFSNNIFIYTSNNFLRLPLFVNSC